jgi:hypothetical protein
MGLVVKLEASFSGGKHGLLVDFADLDVQVVERGAKGTGQLIVRGQQGRPFGSQDAEIELRREERHLQAVAGRGVAVCVRDVSSRCRTAHNRTDCRKRPLVQHPAARPTVSA